MDGLVPADEGLLWPGGIVVPCVRACLHLCVDGRDDADPGCGRRGSPAPLDPLAQAEHGQPQVVACPTRGDLGQGAGQGLIPRLENAPEDPV